MNITLSIPEDIVKQVRDYASKHHTSMNQLVRDNLLEYVQSSSRQEEANEALDFMRSLPPSLPKGEMLTRSDYSERE